MGDEAGAVVGPNVNPVSVFRTNGFPHFQRRAGANLQPNQNLRNIPHDPDAGLPPFPNVQDPQNPTRLELRNFITASNRRVLQIFESGNLTWKYLLKHQADYGFSLTFQLQPRYLVQVAAIVQIAGLISALVSIHYNDKRWMVAWVLADFVANLGIGFKRATSVLLLYPFSKIESLILILQAVPLVRL